MLQREDVMGLKQIIDWPYLLNNLGFQKINIRTRRCCCLLHGGDNASAFSWNKSFFHCFSCLRSGDAIELVRLIRGLSFVESVEYLSNMCGFNIRTMAKKTKRVKKRGWEIPVFVVERIEKQDYELMQIEATINQINDEITEYTEILYSMRGEENSLPYLYQSVENRLAKLDSDLAYWTYMRNQKLWK